MRLAGLARARRQRGQLLLVASLVVLGCGNKADGGSATPEGGAGATATESSECSGDFDAFDPGMTKTAMPGNIMVKLARAEPSPPIVRLDNVWWLELADADGNALSGAKLVASPYMPKHQHGSAEVVVVDHGEGEYQLSPIELIMPGVWEIPLSVTPAGDVVSKTTFRFCIAER